MIDRIADGRTDLVFEYLSAGHSVSAVGPNGTRIIEWCAYYGDVSAIKFLVANGESLHSGPDLGLNAAAFHGHWRLCQYLIENGADVNRADKDTGETPLHSALSSARSGQKEVVKVLLANGADTSRVTNPNVETGAFMRDCRTKGETPLHRAAAFADEETIQLLLDHGVKREAKDVNGDSPLGWASWYLRPDTILRKLCYGPYSIPPGRRGMDSNLLGEPHTE